MNGSRRRSLSPITAAFQSNRSALRRFILRLIRTQDPDDLVQETFARAFHAEQSKAIERPQAYLFRIAKNVALNDQRSRSRRPTDFLEDCAENEGADQGSTLEEEVMAEELLGLHSAAIAGLPLKCRRVYLLKKVYGMSHDEIASTLSISKKTIEGHLTRAFAHCDAYIERRRQVGSIPARSHATKTEDNLS